MTLEDKAKQKYYKFYYRLKHAVGPACHFFFGTKKENEIRLPKEPCLIVANHTCYFDPVIVAMCVDQPVCFVAAENLLRRKLVKYLTVDIFHSIPCSKGRMNVKTISGISNSLKAGYNVIMFAEGNITYDGITEPLAPVNGKLFRAMKCTVVTIAVTGGYQLLPRWSHHFCRGSIQAQLKGVYTKEMLHDMTPEEILDRFNQDLHVEQPSSDLQKTCRRSAKGIHYVLYACPKCGSLGKIKGKGSKIRCLACGKSWKYNKFGKIEGGRFETIWQWNQWQEKYVRKLVCGESDIRLSSSDASLYRIEDNHKREPLESGMLILDREQLSIGNMEFPLTDIFQMDTRNRGVILFSTNSKDYYEITPGKETSGLMYKTVFEALKEKSRKNIL